MGHAVSVLCRGRKYRGFLHFASSFKLDFIGYSLSHRMSCGCCENANPVPSNNLQLNCFLWQTTILPRSRFNVVYQATRRIRRTLDLEISMWGPRDPPCTEYVRRH